MRRLLCALAAAAALGCGSPTPGDPPEIVFGRHECARCGMIVSEEAYAAGYVADDGESLAFDDLGELLAELEDVPELKARAWARDLGGGGWIRLSEAALLHVPGLATPMGTGWVAFKDAGAAEAFRSSRAGR